MYVRCKVTIYRGIASLRTGAITEVNGGDKNNECCQVLSDSPTVEGAIPVPATGIGCLRLVCTSLPSSLSGGDARSLKPYCGGCAFGSTGRVFVVAFWEGTSMERLVASMRSGRGAEGLYLHSGWSRASLRPARMCLEVVRTMRRTTTVTVSQRETRSQGHYIKRTHRLS